MVRKATTPPVAARSSYDYRTLLTYRLLVLSNTLGKGAVRLYAGRFGIPLAEWRLLAALACEAPTSVTDLAAALATDKGWVSRVAGSLIEQGLAAASDDPADRRRSQIDLTAKGRALYARILPAAEDRQRQLLSVLTHAEREHFDLLLAKLQEKAEALAEDPPERRSDKGSRVQRAA